MVMAVGDKIGNGNGKEWVTTCMGMGMDIIPMGINSHRRIQCYAYVIVQMTTLTENNICDFLRKSKIKTYNILHCCFFWFMYYKNAHMLLLPSVAYLGLSLP